jgi:hypothetical protein
LLDSDAAVPCVWILWTHTRHETSEKHYNQAKGVEAARRYHGLLKEQRERERPRK